VYVKRTLSALRRSETGRLRAALPGVIGVGPEAADDMLRYAFHRPVSVIEHYPAQYLTPGSGNGR